MVEAVHADGMEPRVAKKDLEAAAGSRIPFPDD